MIQVLLCKGVFRPLEKEYITINLGASLPTLFTIDVKGDQECQRITKLFLVYWTTPSQPAFALTQVHRSTLSMCCIPIWSP